MQSEIRLRALTWSDLPKTLEWNNQQDIVDLYSGHPFPVNKEMESKWYERMLTSNIPTMVFGIEIIDTKTLIGLTVLRNIDLINRSAESGTYIGDVNVRGKGYFIDAMLLNMEFGFTKLGLNRIMGKVLLESNNRLVKSYIKFGYTQEGVLRNAVYKNGKFHSLALLSVLRDEYLAKFSRYLNL